MRNGERLGDENDDVLHVGLRSVAQEEEEEEEKEEEERESPLYIFPLLISIWT